MPGTSVIENVEFGVHPHVSLGHFGGRWHHKRLVLFSLIGNDLEETVRSLILLQLHDTVGEQGRRVANSGKLCSQVVLLLSEEEWVGVDLSV